MHMDKLLTFSMESTASGDTAGVHEVDLRQLLRTYCTAMNVWEGRGLRGADRTRARPQRHGRCRGLLRWR